MKEIDDITIKAAAKKDAKAFRRVYDYYSPFVWKVVFRTTNGDMDAATEIMQDVFVKVYQSLKSYRFGAAFSTWLYRIAYTTTLNLFRRRTGARQRFVKLEEANTTTNPTDTVETRDVVERVLDNLTPHERFLLVAREVDGVSFEELERMTGRSAGSLRTRLSRLKETIRKGLGNEKQ